MTTRVETMQIAPMRWWHVEAVERIERDVFPEDAWSREQFWSELAQSTRRYLVALDGDDVVAYAGLFVLPPDADVQTVAVAPRAQGAGLATRLLSDLLTDADAQGVTHTMLEVRDGNTPALAVYARLGFEQISRRPRYYPDGVDALILRRPRPERAS
jgi:[ribosomal protein S18]-alanine N-acetyltransferase